jgi:integrase
MKRSDIVDRELHVIQQKTGAELHLPIVTELERAMRAYPAKGLTLIGTEDGRPMTRAGLSQFMRGAVKDAELPAKCVSHGLRKAAMRRLAEGGKTEKQIAAVSGHKTLREVERYTAAADQRRLARDAMGDKKRTRLPNRSVPNDSRNHCKISVSCDRIYRSRLGIAGLDPRQQQFRP